MKSIILKASLLAGAVLLFASASPVQSQECSSSGSGYSSNSGSSRSFFSFFRPIRLWFGREQPVQYYEASQCQTSTHSSNCTGCSKCQRSTSATTSSPYYYAAPRTENQNRTTTQRRAARVQSSGTCVTGT